MTTIEPRDPQPTLKAWVMGAAVTTITWLAANCLQHGSNMIQYDRTLYQNQKNSDEAPAKPEFPTGGTGLLVAAFAAGAAVTFGKRRIDACFEQRLVEIEQEEKSFHKNQKPVKTISPMRDHGVVPYVPNMLDVVRGIRAKGHFLYDSDETPALHSLEKRVLHSWVYG